MSNVLKYLLTFLAGFFTCPVVVLAVMLYKEWKNEKADLSRYQRG